MNMKDKQVELADGAAKPDVAVASGSTPVGPAVEPTAHDVGAYAPSFREGLGRLVGRTVRGENAGLLILVLVVFVGIFAVVLRNTTFFSSTNLLSIVKTTAPDAVMAVPLVFVVACGEIDLSFAYIIPLSAYVAAILLPTHGLILSTLAAIGFGVGVGLVNGVVTVGLGIPSFVVTLGMLGFLEGYSQVIANDATLTVVTRTFLSIFGQGKVFGSTVNASVLWTVGVVAIGAYVLSFTRAGRGVLATGGNQNAARYSGIRTNRVKVLVFIFAGVGGALGGLIYLGQYTTAAASLGGSSDLLNVLAAVIIGGTVLTGGRGSVIGALVGTWLIGVIANALVIVGVSSPEELMAEGAIIIVTVVVSSRRGARRRGGQSGVFQKVSAAIGRVQRRDADISVG